MKEGTSGQEKGKKRFSGRKPNSAHVRTDLHPCTTAKDALLPPGPYGEPRVGGAAYLWPCGPPPWDICLLPTTCASGFPGGCSPAAGEWPGRTRRGTRSLQEQEAGAKAPLRSTPRSRALPCHQPAPNAPPGTLGALSLRASPRNPLLPCWGCP